MPENLYIFKFGKKLSTRLVVCFNFILSACRFIYSPFRSDGMLSFWFIGCSLLLKNTTKIPTPSRKE